MSLHSVGGGIARQAIREDRQRSTGRRRRSYVLPTGITTAMSDLFRVSTALALALSLSVPALLGLAVGCEAEDAEPLLVPEPWVHETHEYDVPGDVDGTPTDEYFVNEGWSVEVRHGDVMTLIMAREITQGEFTSVDYQNNIHYDVGGKLYIAQFTINEAVFRIGGLDVHAPLTSCGDFTVEHSEVVYDGTVPTLDIDVSFMDIRVYPDASSPAELVASTFDLTLLHHVRCDWNDTSMKVEALLEFADTRFFDPSDGNAEFGDGEPFTAEVWYTMMLANPEDFRTSGPLIPTNVMNDTLEYNLTLDGGIPLTMSRLEMRDSFTIRNATGDSASTGYSHMEMDANGFARVTHGFPGLAYGDTQSMLSDPEIVIYHDTVTEAYSPFDWMPVVAALAAACAGTVALTIFLVWRRRARGKG